LLVTRILLGLLAIVAPIALYAALASRGDLRPASPRAVALTFALGVLAFVPAEIAERALTSFTGLRRTGAGGTDLAAFVYAFLVAAPIEQALKVVAVVPVWRLRGAQHRPFDGLTYAIVAALGFSTAQGAAFLIGRGASPLDAARAAIWALTQPCLSAMWGWAIGRSPKGRIDGQYFRSAWLLAMVGSGVSAQVIFFARGPAALIAVVPIIVFAGIVTAAAARDLLQRGAAATEKPPAPRAPRLLTAIAPPSIKALRTALRREERPISFFWIGLGALVTAGVIVTMVALAVALGHKLGVDFAVVDRDASQPAAVAPLVLLTAAAILAFPVAGWVIARASATRSVFEPAISTSLAIFGVLVLLGLAAPVAMVFALACAPLAFGLACAGAWAGRAR
jgi:RsiW-degrading membrane proteinase PrsW (M82 family)